MCEGAGNLFAADFKKFLISGQTSAAMPVSYRDKTD